MQEKKITPINFYSDLRYAFRHAMKARRMLRLAFFSNDVSRNTYFLRATIAFMIITFFFSFFEKTGWLFFLTIALEMMMFYLAELEIQKGVQSQLGADSAVSKLSRQPWRLRRSLMRYAYFKEYVQKHGASPSAEDLDRVLQFIETNRSGKPPAWTNFFRHPLVITMLGIFVYTFNSQIIGSPAQTSDWQHFALVSLGLMFVLVVAGLVYTLRYMDPNEDWQFECCLRWYRIEVEMSGL